MDILKYDAFSIFLEQLLNRFPKIGDRFLGSIPRSSRSQWFAASQKTVLT
jgi:hypothetical protein